MTFLPSDPIMPLKLPAIRQKLSNAFPAHHLFLCLIASITLGVAWLLPMTSASAILTILSFSCFCLLFEQGSSLPCFWLLGVLSQAIGFYWLVDTMSFFGGFPWILAALIFAAYCLAFGAQIPLAAWLAYRIPTPRTWLVVNGALGWTISEFAFPRLFPWMLPHTLTSIPYLPLLAALGGSYLVSLITATLIHSAVVLTQKNFTSKTRLLTGTLALVSWVIVNGIIQTNAINAALTTAKKISVAIPQANVSVQEKHNQRSFEKNTTQYLRLSEEAIKQYHPDLVIWPETVVQDWLPTAARSVLATQRFPRLPGKSEAHPLTPLIFGALTYTNTKTLHNSAVTISSDGSVPPPYHKQILLPFGEYMPFAETFPWIQKINPLAAGAFTAGKESRVVSLPFLNDTSATQEYTAASLICYEDVVPSLSRIAVKAGASLLVNVTNDGWFRESKAPYQHHLIAAYRAIENRRYLIRSTNTGLTAIVDPFGKTIASIPAHKEGILTAAVVPLTSSTLYETIGDAWLMVVSLVVLALSLLRLADHK
jgi:apolipoprotein N-acyltransferase